jgi:ribonuclease D
MDDAAEVDAMSGWRRQLFGEAALRLKRGEIALRLDGRRVALVEIPLASDRAEAAE